MACLRLPLRCIISDDRPAVNLLKVVYFYTEKPRRAVV